MKFRFSAIIAGFSIIVGMAVAIASVDLRWTDSHRKTIAIIARDREAEILNCLESSLKARLRFEVRICRKRIGWTDHCEEARSELHTATFDEVTESYRVVSDRFDDTQEPVAVGVPTRSDAIRLVTTLDSLPLSFLIRDEPEILAHANPYLQVRTIFMCRGNASRPFTHLSRILTLGLLNNVENRSDWSDFNLK